MYRFLFLLIVASFISCDVKMEVNADESGQKTPPAYAMVIHGGAGTILKAEMTEEKRVAYHTALDTALTIGQKILKEGGTSLDAIEQTIHYLEDSPLFNAGKGAVFTNAGTNELDASIMDGSDLNAGAVGGISVVKHPISAARAVMEKSDHVLLSGTGAEEFSKAQGLETVDPSYFKTDRRWNSLQRILEKEKETGNVDLDFKDFKYGTVGAVALDNQGNIAAGTSTGGMTNKKWNRIGDSPIIGAGTYANNATCGVSCTGHGEYFIRYAVAHDISACMEYTGKSLQLCADEIVNTKLLQAKGSGGLVALDKYGNVAMPFNTEGMYRGYVTPEERVIKMYKEE